MKDSDINKKIEALTNLIISDYEKKRAIDEIEPIGWPNKNLIIEILDKIKAIIYPGYYKNGNNKIHSVKNNIAILLEDVFYDLSEQIAIVLNSCQDINDSGQKNNAKSREIAFDFLNMIPKIREYLDTDIDAIFNNDPAAYNKNEIICVYPGLFAIFANRIAHELYLLGVPLIPRIITEYAHSITGIDIHPGVKIGKYFFIDHGTGVVIGGTSIIGSNVKIYQNVTLGALSTSGGQKLKGIKRHPTISDNVTIYSGATILGGETVIGENTTIGGNVFITNSVPPNTKVLFKNQELIYNHKK